VPEENSEAADAAADLGTNLGARLSKALKTGEDWELLPNKHSVYFTYFRHITNARTAKKTEICVLCLTRLKVKSASNAMKHLERCTKLSKAMMLKIKNKTLPRFTPKESPIAAAFQKLAAEQASRALTAEETSRLQYQHKLPELSAQDKALLERDLVDLCTARLLPYNFVEWPELRRLIEHCVLFKPAKVRRGFFL
jgi:hypothetical protein